ncbi:transcriptional regulator with XRE-family HTH domain [Thermocatellispora tengchongensis]|uniref:Transcriptional regulator with XRE-family HTH domain n=1 Tax=Thermocatellispora tengchongensis TaxID=1073253 RepID=A0A840P0T6_9ACTN|nr:helix-turn-helix transcriptional regulator [Thermocatellispora tengchongensis]MBB5132589.1 transcriptional regulator with XRE-family HTH domain [Thermocatellispora tengchongensis]
MEEDPRGTVRQGDGVPGPAGAGGRGPTVRRRRLAAELRVLRERAGLTGEQAGERLGWSVSKISRIETGQVGVRNRDLAALLDLYEAPNGKRDALTELGRTAAQRGWWDTYESIPTEYANYISLESEASSIRCFSQTLIHGLLQTEDYARAVIRAALIPFAPASEIDRRVEVRMTRQKVLHRDPPLAIWMVLDEAALHRMVGNPEIMRAQCESLIRQAELPNVTIQVLSSAAGAHPGANTPFSILAFPELYDPDVVYIETMMSNLWIEDDGEVHRYSLAFDQLHAMALSPDDSRTFISQAARRL